MENKVLSKSFLWMALGLLLTFGTGYVVSINENMLENIFSGAGYIVFIVIEFILVIILSARIMKMKPTMAKICFLLYAFVSGLTFSSIFVVFEMKSIMFIFLVTAAIFGVLSYIGANTKMDLTKVGTYLVIGLIGAIIVSLLNVLIFKSTAVELGLSILILIIFLGLTAFDVQKILKISETGIPEDNAAIYGALELYLDFINIFIKLLQLFGKGRD